ncbi:SRPBCC family protein [Psychromonas sp. CD1]|uniref:SRPBCC family protein n=1 Tax=Psychromonas sp. CD1 TaxID=1979839 RepID=UPI000B9B249F|nr:SRPBCC family protein [Psychromonas sp. CD1]
MVEVSRSALLMYSADEMYQLVNDVESYPAFLPGCVGAQLLMHENNLMRACIKVSKAGISQSFTTENKLTPGRQIEMRLIEGPFKSLSGGWVFIPLDDQACKVIFDLKFEFSSKLIEFAFGRIFNELVGSMVNSFAVRAKFVYGIR